MDEVEIILKDKMKMSKKIKKNLRDPLNHI